MLALFSTGPIGFSDAPGWTNATLLARTCNANGTLLQPSRPVTSVDSTFDVTPGAAPRGYVLGTHSSIDGTTAAAHYVLSHQLASDFSLRALDLWPPITPGARYAAVSWHVLQRCANESAAASCGVALLTAPPLPAGQLLVLPRYAPGTDPFAPSLTVVVPRCPASGAALLGEAAKFATVSSQRVTALQCTAAGLTLTVQGLPGEAVELFALAGQGGAMRVAVARVMLPGPRSRLAAAASCVLDGSTFSCGDAASDPASVLGLGLAA